MKRLKRGNYVVITGKHKYRGIIGKVKKDDKQMVHVEVRRGEILILERRNVERWVERRKDARRISESGLVPQSEVSADE